MWEAQLLRRQDIDEAQWNAFVEVSPQEYLYFYTWFLDAAHPDWQAIEVRYKGHPFLKWPLPVKRKGFLRYAFQPRLTQFGGPMVAPVTGTNFRHKQLIKSALQHAIGALPTLFSLNINLHPALDYFLPFHWAGFQVRPLYTYWLPVSEGFATVEANFSSSIRDDIKKARKKGYTVRTTGDATNLLALTRAVGIFDPAHEDAFRKIWSVVSQYRTAVVIEGLAPGGQVAGAAAYIVDGARTIFLSSALQVEHRQAGVGALLTTEGIALACRSGCQWFDFEGSMLPSVEQFFLRFNPKGKVYWNVSWRWPS